MDKDSNNILVYPHDSYKKYYLNEIPSYLNGTVAIIIKPNAKFEEFNDKISKQNVNPDSLLEIKRIMIRKGSEKTNYYYRQRIIGVNLESEETSYYSSINFSGYSSTDNRYFYNSLFQDKNKYKSFKEEAQKSRDIFKIDTMYLKSANNNFPFKYSVNMTGRLGKFYNFLNDSTIIITVGEILNNNKIEYNKQYRNLDILIPYAFSDIQDLIIEFPKNIKVINSENLNKEIFNLVGNYKFELANLGNKLHLTSTYSIRNESIVKILFNDLDILNKASNDMSNARIIVEIEK